MKHDFHIIFSLFSGAGQLQKKRAMLTIASIAWGTVAILLLLAFGEGLKLQLDKNRRAMGENISVLWPGETTKAWKGLPPGRPIRPRVDDIEFVRSRMPELKSVIGELVSWRTSVSWERKTINGRINGVNYDYGEARKHFPVAGGRWLSPEDEKQRRRVVFLGDEMATDLFGKVDPVCIPISTWKAQFGRERLNNMLIETRRPEDMEPALKKFNEIMGAKLGYDPTDDRAFGTWNTVKSQKTNSMITGGIQMFLGIVGALTLLIGGVGVANIMFAVVMLLWFIQVLVSVVFGLMVVAWPGAGALAMVLVIGSFAILYGILLIGFSFKLRKAAEVRI